MLHHFRGGGVGGGVRRRAPRRSSVWFDSGYDTNYRRGMLLSCDRYWVFILTTTHTSPTV
jgi:hypothetical protein